MVIRLTMRRHSGPWQVGVAAASMTVAVLLTHALWSFVHYAPFICGFAATILTSRLCGRQAGFLAVALGVFGYALFPPPLPQAGLGFLLGFAIISSTFS